MKAIITVGVSASGKSTWARKFKSSKFPELWIEINRDNERRNILFEKTEGQVDELVWACWKWKWEKEVTQRCEENLLEAANAKASIIVSDTNLNKGRREALMKRLEDLGYEVEVKLFPISFEEACKRDAARKNGVGYDVIAKQFEQWDEEFAKRPQPKNEDWCPPAVIVDVDGTLAKMNGRSPFDWDRVNEDQLNEPVAEIVRGLYAAGYRIVIMSGRDGCCFAKTRAWIEDNKIPFDHLLMRAKNDQRPDTIIKEELYWQHVDKAYAVKFVIDDRPKVCRMWRAKGFEVLQVGNPYIDF